MTNQAPAYSMSVRVDEELAFPAPPAAMPPRMSYVICATPRSGTTMLCDLLAATGVAGAPQSYYRRQDISKRAEAWGLLQGTLGDPGEFDRAYLQAVLRDGAGSTDVFGLRLMWDGVAELSERLSRLYAGETTTAALFERAFGPLVYVHVSREDKVAQAVSLLRAHQSGLWHLSSDGTERQRTAPAAPVSYDGDRIAKIVDELEHDDAAWTAFFAAQEIAPLRVTYDGLVARPGIEVGAILAALGCAPQTAAAITPQTAKMADRMSQEWADRFRQSERRGPGN